MLTVLKPIVCSVCGKTDRNVDIFDMPPLQKVAINAGIFPSNMRKHIKCSECAAREDGTEVEKTTCKICGQPIEHSRRYRAAAHVCYTCDSMHQALMAYNALYGPHAIKGMSRKQRNNRKIKLSNCHTYIVSMLDSTKPDVLSKRLFQINTLFKYTFTKNTLKKINKDYNDFISHCVMNDAMVNYTPGEDGGESIIID